MSEETRTIVPAAAGFYWLMLEERGDLYRSPITAWVYVMPANIGERLNNDNVLTQPLLADGAGDFYLEATDSQVAVEAPDGTLSDQYQNWANREEWLDYCRDLFARWKQQRSKEKATP